AAEVSSNFKSSTVAVFKHLCGEYPGASSFALWLAHAILKTNSIPPAIIEAGRDRRVRSILIYNRYFRDHHSLMLLTKDE
ncbi:MAG TPA: hypothetical protein VKQ08_04370, partial [Cyclobacteriaceae bacterium]|nr:hypothetical protein [Cyclobacteriaceae bacterium]